MKEDYSVELAFTFKINDYSLSWLMNNCNRGASSLNNRITIFANNFIIVDIKGSTEEFYVFLKELSSFKTVVRDSAGIEHFISTIKYVRDNGGRYLVLK